MRIGTSLTLLAVGAILAFALNDDDILGIDFGVVGIVLMVVSLVGLGISLYYLQGKQAKGETVSAAVSDPDDAAPGPNEV